MTLTVWSFHQEMNLLLLLIVLKREDIWPDEKERNWLITHFIPQKLAEKTRRNSI